MSIETRRCILCGFAILVVDGETRMYINCNNRNEFEKVMDSIDYVDCRQCGAEIVVDKSDPHLCDNCNGEY